MNEVERFTVQAGDGRTWRFALLQRTTAHGRDGSAREYPGGTEYKSLDDPDRFYINQKSEGVFLLVDFHSDDADVEVRRV